MLTNAALVNDHVADRTLGIQKFILPKGLSKEKKNCVINMIARILFTVTLNYLHRQDRTTPLDP